ncbi:OX-2 membrane glycoprotein-like [Cheilinus undulatus]|uniref:OX-2 membrane glycoprotein-like n=1 Tax=Cheilinus undulatus TaxID=241271 RepID=UPI001BD51282|nr:OX-2 membrane glycoprotein-like [Cheilinus undulatus]
MLHILIITSLLFKASTSHIISRGNRTADFGKDAYFSCVVSNPTGVLQVTWQRLFKDESIENLATFSKRFGEQVNEPYRRKIIFTEASLNSTSITVKNVTWEDESCYICSFNIYPEGSQRKQICLTVQGISKVKTEVQAPSVEQQEDEENVEVAVSCSATGKPAPTIEWDFSADATHLDNHTTTKIMNSDRTFTSSSNITLQVHSDWNGYVDCVINKGAPGQRRETRKFTFGGEEDRKTGETVKRLSSSGIALVISSIIFLTFIVVAFVLNRKRLIEKRSRNTQVV